MVGLWGCYLVVVKGRWVVYVQDDTVVMLYRSLWGVVVAEGAVVICICDELCGFASANAGCRCGCGVL